MAAKVPVDVIHKRGNMSDPPVKENRRVLAGISDSRKRAIAFGVGVSNPPSIVRFTTYLVPVWMPPKLSELLFEQKLVGRGRIGTRRLEIERGWCLLMVSSSRRLFHWEK